MTLPADSGGPAYAGTGGLGAHSGGDDRGSFHRPLALAIHGTVPTDPGRTNGPDRS
ncbi:hypothetical protein [Amycolatopsis sp. WAC 04197]|uniref:hypothetical protein n=1 Tax=Amycolatopsis sp. WAC 04197 TaxID=2203199 RepID=UPI0013155D91|nr:hypothetical protein [Amycolatopsis sp. WAC 04197]